MTIDQTSFGIGPTESEQIVFDRNDQGLCTPAWGRDFWDGRKLEIYCSKRAGWVEYKAAVDEWEFDGYLGTIN